MNNNYTYRFIEDSELDKLVELFDTFNRVFDTPLDKISEARTVLLESFTLPYRKHAGCFDEDGKLVCSISGYFPKNKTYWYGYNYMSRISNVSLASGKHASLISANTIRPLCLYAESNNINMFYVRRPAAQQFLADRAMKKEFHPRYEIFIDGFYPANAPIINSMHSFYTRSMNVDSSISLYVLKQEFRQANLANEFPQYAELVNKFL